MTDSFFDVYLWPTLVGGVTILIIMILVYNGLSLVEKVMKMKLEHGIDLKDALLKALAIFWIVAFVLATSWFIGRRLLEIYYE